MLKSIQPFSFPQPIVVQVLVKKSLTTPSGKIKVNNLNKTTERTLYNKIISKDFSINRNLINHYDLFPTILNLLDFSFKNNRLGLGYSAIKDTDINNYNSYFKNLEENIGNKSDRYVEFWK